MGHHHKPRRGASTTSSVSQESQSGRPPISPRHVPRADSPSLGDQRITSGVSDVSDTARGHLRGISETSVSTDGNGNYATPAAVSSEGLGPQNVPETHEGTSEKAARLGVVSPMTPPDMVNVSNDYMGARGTTSTASPMRRKSNFAEKLDEENR